MVPVVDIGHTRGYGSRDLGFLWVLGSTCYGHGCLVLSIFTLYTAVMCNVFRNSAPVWARLGASVMVLLLQLLQVLGTSGYGY